MPRIFCPEPLAAGRELALPPNGARHVQVLRLQPGAALTLFDGEGGEWLAQVERMGRSDVLVRVLEHHAIEREAPVAVHLAVSMFANERMDWLVEKATELGAASIQPLVSTRSLVRVAGERAQKKQAHWRAVAIAACEQCGRNRIPQVHDPVAYDDWLGGLQFDGARWLLSLAPGTRPLAAMQDRDALFLSGPEGGFSAEEERAALDAGFAPVTLGARVLRAETAPLAALSKLA